MTNLFSISDVKDEISQHVILVHGLGGDPYDTWQSLRNPQECWPKWLAEDIEGLVVWTVGYEAAVSRWHGSAMHLIDRATNVLERILLEPKLQTGEIVLVGHSLGGLVIKQLIRTADSMMYQRHDAAAFVKRVRRIAFLATPHSGSDLATWGDRLRVFIRPSAATASLVRNDPNLRELNFWYREWSAAHDVAHLILTESQPTHIVGLVVKPDSSDPGLASRPISIDADHITICKPKDHSSEIYLLIRDFITRQISAAHRETVIEDALKVQSLKIEKLTDKVIAFNIHPPAQNYPKELVDNEIIKRISNIRRARFFKGFSTSEHSIRLAETIQRGEFEGGSYDVKSGALAWCARFLSIDKDHSKSDELLNLARQLGNGPEIIVAEAFRISADGDLGGALNKLANVTSSNARSAAFIIVNNQKDATSAIDWLSKSRLTFPDLDADGKFFLITKHLELCHWDVSLEYANALHEEDYQEAPVLFHAAAMAQLVQAIPNQLKTFVLQQVPFEASSFPLASDQVSIQVQRKAQELFSKCASEAQELGCIDAAKIADDYALWLELRDPEGLSSGLEKLRLSMRDSAHSLRRLHFALQFGLKLDLDAVEREIEKRSALSGGESSDAAMARFSLAFTQGSPKAIADYIDRHRTQLHKYLEKKSIIRIEIEMLVQARLLQRAEERLIALTNDEISEEDQSHLRRIIEQSTRADPIEACKAQYESSDQLNDLANLVNLLEEQNDWPQLCHFGALLFDKTRSLLDAERLAKALSSADRYRDLSGLLRKYPEFLDQSDMLQTIWSWALYREGALVESAAVLEKLRARRDYPSDRVLKVNLAIASGAWDDLLPHVEEEWANREEREAGDLMQVAQLAQLAGSPRAKELVYSVATKGANDASILVAAYSLATSAGWEDEEAVVQWLHNAAKLSGDSGPIQRMSTKDILDQAPEWNRRENETWKNLSDGNIPIFGAAKLLNRSLIDIFLLPALANPSEQDPRRRAIVPAYSGVRQPLPCNYQVVALDATTLLTLGVLGLLKKVSNMFESIVIPHSTLGWLFEEKQQVLFHQPSRIINASALRHLLAIGSLKTFIGSTEIDADLATKIGGELASLIAEAQAGSGGDEKQRLVIRSSPVHCVGSLMEEEADLSPYHSHLCSCLGVVNKLKQKGQLTATEEHRARSYLSLHEKEWPHPLEISDSAVLYLDGLSVTYLQHTGLLKKLRPAGLEAYVSTRKIEEGNALLRYEQLTSEVSEVIEVIRKFLADAIQVGTVKVGRTPLFDDAEESTMLRHPTFASIDLAEDVEAIIVDDRFLNQHGNIDSESGHTPILTTLDLMDALYSKGDINLGQMLDYRTRLRRSTYLFVPVTSGELEHHLSAAPVVNGRLVETAELKIIRENIQRIRMSRFLQLPREAPWLDGLMQTFSHELKSQWCPEVDEVTAGARSEWLLEFLDVRGWSHCFAGVNSENIAVHGRGAQIMSLLLAPSDISTEIKGKYWEWIEEHVLTKVQEGDPSLYSWIINRAQELISSAAERDLSKENE
ncbi:MAG: HNH endonuclease [Candidatus Sedimenticola sp. (ex Thyasira tokunagai)]